MNGIRRQIHSMLRVEPRAGGFRAAFKVDPQLAVLPDHFRNSPILPGVCMIQAVLIGAAQAVGVRELRMRSLKSAKMMRPVRPGDSIQIDAELTPGADGDMAIKASLTAESGPRCAEFSLIARASDSREGGNL